uniref:Uncharacterized protein 008L n=1 Tax=Anthurium amnicola TaxID=1678845 RepID=A0A1D1YNA3_9ARAE
MPSWKVWPSPPPRAHTFVLELVVRDLTGLPVHGAEDARGSSAMVQVEWSGGRRRSGVITWRTVERNWTAKQRVRSDGTVGWWEGFRRECKLKMDNPGSFKSWIVNLEVHGFGGISNGPSPILAKTQLDISKFFTLGEERSVGIPLRCGFWGYSAKAELKVALKFSDPRIKRGTVQETITRALSLRGSSRTAFPQTDGGHVWGRRTTAESGGDSRSSASESARWSGAGLISEEEIEWDDGKLVAATGNSHLVNQFGGKLEHGEGKKIGKRGPETNHPPHHRVSRTSSLRRILSWNREKLFEDRSLLYKASAGGGGSDQQLSQSSAASSLSSPRGQEQRVPEIEGDVGSWEERAIASRDGRLELVTEVFLASIDQRSEKAAGESACSVLAAVIADWLHRNPGALPLRFQFDELVREGSSEWRRLCADEGRLEQFSDLHFDLDTVLGAKVRPLAVVTGSSYVGFFGLEGSPEGFEYLQGAMSFDDVWEELLRPQPGDGEEGRVYIAGWNDHFFVLKVDAAAVYLVDTLGERLFEGCNQAYILKFHRGSRVYAVDRQEEQSSDRDEVGRGNQPGAGSTGRGRVVCAGLAAGKEFIKGFLAALPLRELQADMEKGKTGRKTHLHRLLQIEFHYTSPL